MCSSDLPSITVIRNAADPETGKIEGEVKWEESTCDGCMICVEACPQECITLEREIIIPAIAMVIITEVNRGKL